MHQSGLMELRSGFPNGVQRHTLIRGGRLARETGWVRWLPGLQMFRHNEIAWLRHDLVAGLVLTTVSAQQCKAKGRQPLAGSPADRAGG